MNGVFPMMLPVSGSRSGAPGGSVASRTTPRTTRNPYSANRRPRASAAGVSAAPVAAARRCRCQCRVVPEVGVRSCAP